MVYFSTGSAAGDILESILTTAESVLGPNEQYGKMYAKLVTASSCTRIHADTGLDSRVRRHLLYLTYDPAMSTYITVQQGDQITHIEMPSGSMLLGSKGFLGAAALPNGLYL